MSLFSQLRISTALVVLCTMQLACVSVPEVESRLKGMQLAPHTYVVQPGDTIETVAFRYQLDPVQLASMNPHLENGVLVGQRIIVHQAPMNAAPIASVGTVNHTPVATQPVATTAATTSITAAVAQPTQTYQTPNGTVGFDQITEIPANAVAGSAARTPVEEVVPDDLGYTTLPLASQDELLAPTTVAAPAGNATAGWVWPTWGEVAREFAPTEAGGQGIDIAGVPGQEIHASTAGTVAYAGRDLAGGNGKLIILRHNDGLMTTYSHAQQLFVAEDDVVRAGDVIASLGANARNESVLRFEVRQNGNPLNPMNFLSN